MKIPVFLCTLKQIFHPILGDFSSFSPLSQKLETENKNTADTVAIPMSLLFTKIAPYDQNGQ